MVSKSTYADHAVTLTTGEGDIVADVVVLALPPALAAASINFDPALPEAVASAARSTPVWMGGMTKAVVSYPDAFWRRAGLSGSGISHAGPMREVHDMSGVDGVPGAIFGFVPARQTGEPNRSRRRLVLSNSPPIRCLVTRPSGARRSTVGCTGHPPKQPARPRATSKVHSKQRSEPQARSKAS